MLREIAVENYTDIPKALAAGADRIELNDNLAVAIPETKQLAAIDWLAAHHVDRILTHGGPLSTPIETTLPHLQALIAHAAQKQITILPGGITSQNAATISEQLGVKELHGTKLIAF